MAYKPKPLIVSYPPEAPADEQATLRFRMWTAAERRRFMSSVYAIGKAGEEKAPDLVDRLDKEEMGLFVLLLESAEGLPEGKDVNAMPVDVLVCASEALRKFLRLEQLSIGLGMVIRPEAAHAEARPNS